MRFALGAILAGIAVLASAGVHAQQPPVARVVVGAVEVEDNTGVASVTVLDAAGNPVTGLQQGSFTVHVDGQPVQVSAVSSSLDAALPLGVILVIDTSGSMAQNFRLEAAKQAVRPLVEALQPGDQMALVTFANGVSNPVPATNDKTALLNAINSLTPNGNTALYAATAQSAALAQALTPPRKAVVFLSDGEEFGNVSGISREQALNAAATSNVPFFAIGIGQVDIPYLTALAAPAGGQLLLTSTPQELSALYTRIAERLRVQYTVRFALPGLDPGDHTVTVTSGSASGETTLTVDGSIAATATFANLPSELREKTTVSLNNVTSNTRVNWSIDGTAISSESGPSIELDPYTFPSGAHTLTAAFDPSDLTKVATAEFTVPPLPPLLVSPTEIPDLQPGELIRIEWSAQPGVAVTAIYSIDGEEFERDTEAPYEVTVPERDYSSGDHDLVVALEGAGQRSQHTYEFEGPGGASTNYGAYGIIALAALGALAGAGYGGRIAWARYQDRARPVDLSGVAPALEEWARERRGDEDESPAPAPSPQPPAPGAWGTLVVVSAPKKGDKPGARFPLKDDTELVGRGKFCSVRLKDRAVQEAHFVITREGQLHASTPSCQIELEGEPVRQAHLQPGQTLRIGDTALRFEAFAPAVAELGDQNAALSSPS